MDHDQIKADALDAAEKFEACDPKHIVDLLAVIEVMELREFRLKAAVKGAHKLLAEKAEKSAVPTPPPAPPDLIPRPADPEVTTIKEGCSLLILPFLAIALGGCAIDFGIKEMITADITEAATRYELSEAYRFLRIIDAALGVAYIAVILLSCRLVYMLYVIISKWMEGDHYSARMVRDAKIGSRENE